MIQRALYNISPEKVFAFIQRGIAHEKQVFINILWHEIFPLCFQWYVSPSFRRQPIRKVIASIVQYL